MFRDYTAAMMKKETRPGNFEELLAEYHALDSRFSNGEADPEILTQIRELTRRAPFLHYHFLFEHFDDLACRYPNGIYGRKSDWLKTIADVPRIREFFAEKKDRRPTAP
jgi:hypothetical protein